MNRHRIFGLFAITVLAIVLLPGSILAQQGRPKQQIVGLDGRGSFGGGYAEPVVRGIVLAQVTLPSLKEVNLLSVDEGGQAAVVPTNEWLLKPISGKEDVRAGVNVNEEAVYAFKDEKAAVFSKFSTLIVGADVANPRRIQILAGDSPTGEFRSLGFLDTVNARIVKSPYQEINFSSTKAKYVKIKILTNWGACCNTLLGQIRLLGTLAE